jgi:hypothetical protein
MRFPHLREQNSPGGPLLNSTRELANSSIFGPELAQAPEASTRDGEIFRDHAGAGLL